MKSTQDVLRILHEARPRLAQEFGVTRLALFGSYARGDQREDSDVDVLVEVAPSIGLRFVDLADRIEALVGVRSDVVSRRASRPANGPISSRNWSMSDRPVDLLIEDILERIRRIGRYTRDLDHDAFVQDEKTVDAVVRSLGVIGEAARRVPQSSRIAIPESSGVRSSDYAIASCTTTSTWTSISSGRSSEMSCQDWNQSWPA